MKSESGKSARPRQMVLIVVFVWFLLGLIVGFYQGDLTVVMARFVLLPLLVLWIGYRILAILGKGKD